MTIYSYLSDSDGLSFVTRFVYINKTDKASGNENHCHIYINRVRKASTPTIHQKVANGSAYHDGYQNKNHQLFPYCKEDLVECSSKHSPQPYLLGFFRDIDQYKPIQSQHSNDNTQHREYIDNLTDPFFVFVQRHKFTLQEVVVVLISRKDFQTLIFYCGK